MNNENNNQSNVITARVPRFLLGKPRTQWKGVMVRRDEIGTEGVRVITLDDVIRGNSNEKSPAMAAATEDFPVPPFPATLYRLVA